MSQAHNKEWKWKVQKYVLYDKLIILIVICVWVECFQQLRVINNAHNGLKFVENPCEKLRQSVKHKTTETTATTTELSALSISTSIFIYTHEKSRAHLYMDLLRYSNWIKFPTSWNWWVQVSWEKFVAQVFCLTQAWLFCWSCQSKAKKQI